MALARAAFPPQSGAAEFNLCVSHRTRVAINRLDPLSTIFAGTETLSYQLLKNCTPCFDPTKGTSKPDSLAVKAYAVYEDPWWITKLGLLQGEFTSPDIDPPLFGR